LNIFEGDKRAQGATEYLLMLAAVLVVVAVAVSMLMGMGPELAVSSPASVEYSSDNTSVIVGTADMQVSPNDATIENIYVVSGGTTVGTINVNSTVANMDLYYEVDVSGEGITSGNDIDELVLADDAGNTVSMTPIVK